jgi:polyhydroxyalkanoate synthesis regulator phasin
MSLGSRLKQEAMGLTQKAMERLFADEQRAAKIASALGSVQRGKEAFDKGQHGVMTQLNVAAKADFKELGKQLSALKRRLRDLDAKIGEL